MTKVRSQFIEEAWSIGYQPCPGKVPAIVPSWLERTRSAPGKNETSLVHRLYLDGQLEDSAALKFDETIQLPLFVGRRFAREGWSYLAGEISELSILGPPRAQPGQASGTA